MNMMEEQAKIHSRIDLPESVLHFKTTTLLFSPKEARVIGLQMASHIPF
jgi:hypothetical protein